MRGGSFADEPAGVAGDAGSGAGREGARTPLGGGHGQPGLRLVEDRSGQDPGPGPDASGRDREGGEDALDDTGAGELLDVVGRLVERAQAAGELRSDVTVADILLVIATAAPSLPNAAQQAAASTRLLDILLEGLRPRHARPAKV
jgi:hypothetical protein